MKLLQINSVANSGSTGRIAEGIGEMVISNSGESYIAYNRNFNASKSNLIKIGNSFNVRLHVIETRIFDNHTLGLASKNATRVLIDQIDIIKPDIIHIHNIHGYYINSNVLFEYLAKINIPIVWTLHDCWSFTGHCSHFDEIGCQKWMTQCYSCPLKKYYPASYFFDRSKNNYQDKKKLFNSIKNLTIVPVSNWLKTLVKESFLPKNEINVIHNGIDLNIFKQNSNNDFTREKYGLSKEFIVIGVSSIWNKSKGLNDFLKLSSLIDSKTKIILVGLTKKQINYLPNNIIGIEKTENIQELAHLYSIAEMFINPTYNDSFPTTNIEALACGTPVLTYNTGGSVEAIDEETGFIVEKGDLQGVLSAIEIVKANGKQYYSQKCRERAEIHFNKDLQFQKYLNLYNQLLKK